MGWLKGEPRHGWPLLLPPSGPGERPKCSVLWGERDLEKLEGPDPVPSTCTYGYLNLTTLRFKVNHITFSVTLATFQGSGHARLVATI